jgi:DNA replication protein DnaC
MNLIPSWLTSWVAWRNFYTEPDKEPFNILKADLGMERLPTSGEFIIKSGGECPYCKDDAVVYNTKLGLVYCLCQVLGKIHKTALLHNDIKTRVSNSSLSEIKYPYEMGSKYKVTMSQFVDAAHRFIKSPDFWIVVSGYYGTGKSHVLKAINAAFDPMALYVSAKDLEQQTHTFRKEDALDYFYDTLINAPILIFDDIGMEYGGPLVKSIFEKVVDTRYERYPDYPLIVSTNLFERELPGYIPRASDRLLDRAKTEVFTLKTEKSYRKIAPEMRP